MTDLTMGQVRKMTGNDLARYLSQRDPEIYGLGAAPKGGSGSLGVTPTSPVTTTSTTAPASIATPVIALNNQLAAVLAPFGPIIDHIPSPPNYPSFTRDFKVRPVDALVNLFTPLDWLAYDIVNRANEISSVHAGSARRIGLPNHQIDFVMGLDMPNISDDSVKAYAKRLIALNNFLILAYQDPKSLAKGVVKALQDAIVAGKVNAQQAAEFATNLIQAAVANGVVLFNGVNEGVVMPDNSFLIQLVNEVKSAFPALNVLAQARAAFDAAKAAAAAAAAQATAAAAAAAAAARAAADAAAAGLARITPIAQSYVTFITTRVGPGNSLLVKDVFQNGDRSIKNAADSIKGKAQYANSNVPPGISAVLTKIANDMEKVKTNASDTQGRKDNHMNLAQALSEAAGLVPGVSPYQPNLADAVAFIIPTSFSGYKGYRGLGVVGVDDAIALAAIGGSAGAGTTATTVTTGGTAGVATAPATTPGIGGLIQQILGMFTGGAGAGAITSILGGGGSAALPVITQQPANITAAKGGSAKFTVVATPPAGATTPLVYQWYKNGTAIPGATQASVTVQNAQPGSYGDDQYMVKISTVANAPAAQVVSSKPANLTVGGAGAGKKQTTLDKALPVILGAGAVVAFPFFPPAAAALAVGAGAAYAKNKKGSKGNTPAQVSPPGDQTISGYALGNANLKALLNGIGDVNPNDPLATVAAGAWKIKVNDTGPGVVAAKALLKAANYGMTTGSTWTSGDQNKVAVYQADHHLPVTNVFDAATLMSLRGSTPTSSSSTSMPNAVKKSVAPAVIGATAATALLYAIFG